MNFPIQSNPQAAFLRDRNCRLFVTVVQSEGIFIRFPASPSRFTFNNCYSGTAMQIRGTVAGIYGIRRLQVKRSGRLGQWAVLALDCCRPPGTCCSFTPKCTRSPLKTGGLERFHGKSARKLFPSVQSVDKELQRSGKNCVILSTPLHIAGQLSSGAPFRIEYD